MTSEQIQTIAETVLAKLDEWGLDGMNLSESEMHSVMFAVVNMVIKRERDDA
jgi:hypothetical protein